MGTPLSGDEHDLRLSELLDAPGKIELEATAVIPQEK
jgi:hypothetical protein